MVPSLSSGPRRSEGKPWRILYLLTAGTVGGITTGLLAILPHLDRRRFRVRVATLTGGAAASLFRKKGFNCFVFSPRRRLQELERWVRREKIDLIQTCDAALDGALIAHRLGLPHIWFLGGTLEATFHAPSSFTLEVLRSAIPVLSDAVVVPSLAVSKEEFQNHPPPNLHTIPWGVDVPEVGKKDRRVYGRTSPVIALIANFYPGKRHLDFLKAAVLIRKRNPGVRFVLAGRCLRHSPAVYRVSRHYWNQVIRYGQRRGLKGSMRVTSFTPEQREAWLQRVDIVLCPSREGLSQAMLEAAAQGIPVVAANIGGMPDLIQHGKTGLLVPYGKTTALAEAALFLLDHPKVAGRLGQALKERVRHTCSASHQARRWEKLYQSLLTKGRQTDSVGRSLP